MNNYIINKTKYKNLFLQNGGRSFVYVFNKLTNTIYRILYNKITPKYHIILSNELLHKMSKKNDIMIQKFIQKQHRYSKNYYHVSRNIIEKIDDTYKNNSSWVGDGIYKNPIGLWISCGISWQKFIGYNPNAWSLATYIYEIIPSNTILYIKNIHELKTFIKTYMKKNIKITDVINWKKVKTDYDGIIICPYLGNKIWGNKANQFGIYGNKKQINNYINKTVGNKWKKDIYYLAEWYRHWETGTGVIWNNNGITNIKLLTRLQTFDKIDNLNT